MNICGYDHIDMYILYLYYNVYMHVVQIMYFNTHQIRNWGVKRLDKLGWFDILGKWSEAGEAN